MADEEVVSSGDQEQSPVQECQPEQGNVAVNQPLDEFPVECPEGEHRLQSPWSWWFDKKLKAPQGTIVTDQDFKANIQHIATVHSVEQFARYYRHCKKPSELPTDCNLHLMRYNTLPMWESFPLGGCWLIKISTKGGKAEADWMWERLLYSAIGEAFASPDMIGVGLSVRPKGIVLSVWNLNESDNQSTRFALGEKLKEIVQLPQYATIEYKLHNQSMRDRSSFRNARPYLIVAAETQQTQAPAMQLPPAAANNTAPPEPTPAMPAAPAEEPAAPAPQEPEPARETEDAPAPEESTEPKEPAKLSFADMAKKKASN